MTGATVTNNTESPTGFRITGRHVLWGLIAFFGVIFAVNGYFLYAALHSYTGVVANEPYRKGLEYNNRIAEDARQHELGWADVLGVAPSRDQLVLDLKDKAGQPVAGLKGVKAAVGRPATNKFDHLVDMTETSPGHYTAAVPKLDDGEWLISVNAIPPANSAGVQTFRLRKRVRL